MDDELTLINSRKTTRLEFVPSTVSSINTDKELSKNDEQKCAWTSEFTEACKYGSSKGSSSKCSISSGSSSPSSGSMQRQQLTDSSKGSSKGSRQQKLQQLQQQQRQQQQKQLQQWHE